MDARRGAVPVRVRSGERTHLPRPARHVSSVNRVCGMYFERMDADYEGARPAYPTALYAYLAKAGLIGLGKQILEDGAGPAWPLENSLTLAAG